MGTTHLSPAAQVIISLTPIAGIVIGGVVVFFYLLWRHREISLQIKTGSYRQKTFSLRLFSLLTGLLLIGVGLALSVVFFLLRGVSFMALGGLIPLAIGVCLLAFYRLYPPPHDDARG